MTDLVKCSEEVCQARFMQLKAENAELRGALRELLNATPTNRLNIFRAKERAERALAQGANSQ